MSLIVPFWFKQRQARAEPAGENTYRVSGPNLHEAYVAIRAVDAKWLGAVRLQADGPDVAVTETIFDTVYDAWEGAFELYRQKFIV